MEKYRNKFGFIFVRLFIATIFCIGLLLLQKNFNQNNVIFKTAHAAVANNSTLCNASKKNQCPKGYYCQKGKSIGTCQKIMKKLNQKCTPNKGECEAHLFCDSSTNTCRGGAGFECKAGKNECGKGYSCIKTSSSKKYICQKTLVKKTINQKCTVGAHECAGKLFCDPSKQGSNTGTCRGGSGYLCKKGDCGSGYSCSSTSSKNSSKAKTCQPIKSSTSVGKCGTCTPGQLQCEKAQTGLYCNSDTHTCQLVSGKHGDKCVLASPSCSACQAGLACIGSDGSWTSGSLGGTCQNFKTCPDKSICGEGYGCQPIPDSNGSYQCVLGISTEPGEIITSIAIKLQGIDVGPQTGVGYKINNNPQTPHRDLEVDLYNLKSNVKGKPDYTATDQVSFNYSNGEFTNDAFNLGIVPDGTYLAFIKTDGFLRKSLGQISIKSSNLANLTQTVPSLIGGDIDGNNEIDILDYNALIACFPDSSQLGNCVNNINANNLADLNDNGNPTDNDWNDDLNLLLTNFGKNGD